MQIIKHCACGNNFVHVPSYAFFQNEGKFSGYFWNCSCKSTLFLPAQDSAQYPQSQSYCINYEGYEIDLEWWIELNCGKEVPVVDIYRVRNKAKKEVTSAMLLNRVFVADAIAIAKDEILDRYF